MESKNVSEVNIHYKFLLYGDNSTYGDNRSWRNKGKNCLIFKETVFTFPSGFDRTARVCSVQ